VFDEWYYVVDCMKGGGSVFLMVAGLLAMLVGLAGSSTGSLPALAPDPEQEEVEDG
jgi:hypothetical protein